jgi:GAF domain-containing protein/multidrug efflux pump subunit AcrA (membrane-fusion protein)
LLDAEQLRQLIRLSHEFNATIDLVDLLPRVLDLVLGTLEAEAGSLWLLDADRLRCEVARGATADVVTGLELPVGAGIVGSAVATKGPILVTDVRGDPRFLHQIDELAGFETQSVIAVPLMARGEVLGAIEVVNERTEDGVFHQHHLSFLEALADDAAAAIRNAKLFEAEKQARDLAALLEVSHEIASTFDIERILVSVVNLAGRAVHFDRCALAIWEEEELRVRAISGDSSVERKAAAVRELERFLSWAAERGEEVFVPDLRDPADELASLSRERFASFLESAGVGGFLVLRIADAEGRLGLLHFEFARANALSEWGRKAAHLLANETALALRNAQLYQSVPFISWLEPLAEKRKALAAVPGSTWLRYGGLAVVALLVVWQVKLPLRLPASEAMVRAAVQQPARAGISGIIAEVLIREGEAVMAGTPIALVRDEELLARVRAAEAALDLTHGEEAAAHARGDASAAAMARVRAAEARDALALLGEKAALARVVAPVSGLVLTSRPEDLLGSFVEAGSPVTWVGDSDWIELEMRIPQHELGDVRVGDRVRARVSAYPSVTFRGQVAAISPRAELVDGVPAVTARAILDNRTRLLLPGMEAHARVITSPRPLAATVLRRPWRALRLRLWW